jgi:hypothetical protein
MDERWADASDAQCAFAMPVASDVSVVEHAL